MEKELFEIQMKQFLSFILNASISYHDDIVIYSTFYSNLRKQHETKYKKTTFDDSIVQMCIK